MFWSSLGYTHFHDNAYFLQILSCKIIIAGMEFCRPWPVTDPGPLLLAQALWICSEGVRAPSPRSPSPAQHPASPLHIIWNAEIPSPSPSVFCTKCKGEIQYSVSFAWDLQGQSHSQDAARLACRALLLCLALSVHQGSADICAPHTAQAEYLFLLTKTGSICYIKG